MEQEYILITDLCLSHKIEPAILVMELYEILD